jgi:hypothetical protein
MSFGSNFRDSFSIFGMLADEERKRRQDELYASEMAGRAEERTSRLESAEMDRELTQSRIDLTEVQTEGAELSLEEARENQRLRNLTVGDLENRDEGNLTFGEQELLLNYKTSALNLDTAKLQNQNEQAVLDQTLSQVDDAEDRKSILKLVNISNLLQDNELDPTVAASMLEEEFLSLKENGTIDFTKFVSPEYFQGWERISPLIEAGDFAGIAENHPDVLTTIFKERLSFFEGKAFQTEDGRTGTIESVSFNGNFNALNNNPSNMIVGANFNVKFGEETESIESFLPDNASNLSVIKQSNTPDDAKVVSVSDVVDRVSAEKDVAMFLVNNPQAMGTYIKAAKGAANFKGDPEQVEQQVQQYFRLKKDRSEYIGNVFNAADKAKADNAGRYQDSAYYQVLYNAEPEIANKYIKIERDDNNTNVYSLKEPDSMDGYRNDITNKYLDPEILYAEIANTYQELGDINNMSDGRKPFYTVEGQVFRRTTTRDQFDAAMTNKLGSDYESIKSEAASNWIYAENFDDITDEMYLAYMSEYIKMKRGQ